MVRLPAPWHALVAAPFAMLMLSGFARAQDVGTEKAA